VINLYSSSALHMIVYVMHAHGSSKQLQERQQAAAKGKIKALASQVEFLQKLLLQSRFEI
jgi:hypothetical protein